MSTFLDIWNSRILRSVSVDKSQPAHCLVIVTVIIDQIISSVYHTGVFDKSQISLLGFLLLKVCKLIRGCVTCKLCCWVSDWVCHSKGQD